MYSPSHIHTHIPHHTHPHTHTLAFFCCYVCKETKTVEIDRGRIAEPAVCPHCQSLHSMALIHNRSLFTDKQMIKLQESPGQKPHHPSLLTTLTPSPLSPPLQTICHQVRPPTLLCSMHTMILWIASNQGTGMHHICCITYTLIICKLLIVENVK